MASTNPLEIHFMKAAIAQAKESNTAFGCVIVEGDEILVKAFNTVKRDKDVTAHAEINALRKLGSLTGHQDKNLTLYTTGEPCPMCMTAIMYAGIEKVVFGVPIVEISKFKKQIMISSQEVVDKGFKQIEVKAGILYQECLNLFETNSHDQR